MGAGRIAPGGAGCRGNVQTACRGSPVVGKWLFSTNGVGSMGTCGVPTIGFGPGDEADAHTVNERVAIEHLVMATQFYAAFR